MSDRYLRTLRWATASLHLGTAYTYLGYPAAIVLLSKLVRPFQKTAAGELPASVSVVVAAYNEAGEIIGRVENILAQRVDGVRLEVIVVTDGSSDGTDEVVRGHDWGGAVSVYHQDKRLGKGAAVNRGVERATSDVLLLTDANNRFVPGTIAALCEPFRDPDVAAVAGRKTVRGGVHGLSSAETLYWRYENTIKTAEATFGACMGLTGEILAIRRNRFVPIPQNVVLDDLYLLLALLKADLRIAYVPLAESFEATSASESGELDRRARNAAGRWLLLTNLEHLPLRRPFVMWQLLSHKGARLLLPFFFFGGMIGLTALAARGFKARSLNKVELISFLGEALAVGSALIPPPRGRGLPARLLYLPRYLVRTNLATLSGLLRSVREPDLARWTRVDRWKAAPPPDGDVVKITSQPIPSMQADW